MKSLIGTKEFYKKLLYIAIPIMIQNGITNFVGMLDNIMVGRIGTDAMSAVAIINQLMFVFNICIFGGLSGAGIFTSQYYGRGDNEGVKYTFRFKAYICALLTVLGLLIFLLFNQELISLYLHDGDSVGNLAVTLQNAKEYLAILLISIIPFTIGQLYSSTLRECGETIIPMVAGIVAVFVNLILNYIFIFGNFGAPALGANGAAIATVVARFIEAGFVVIWTHCNHKKCPYIVGVFKSFFIPKDLSTIILKKGAPLLINEILWATGMAVITQCYAVRGLGVVAALNITSTLVNVFNIVFIALGSSIAIIIGQLLGAGEIEEAKKQDKQLIAFTIVSCTIVAFFMSIFAKIFPTIYNTEEVVKEMASKFIFIAALALPLQSFTNAAYFTLRSGGKTLITFIFDSVFVWCFVIPTAYILSRYTTIPTIGVYFVIQGTEIFKCILGAIMIKRGTWTVNMVESLNKG